MLRSTLYTLHRHVNKARKFILPGTQFLYGEPLMAYRYSVLSIIRFADCPSP